MKTGIQTGIGTPVSIAALFTIVKRWKQPKCPLTDEWINKMSSIHTMEYHSVLKTEEILKCYNMVNFEDGGLSERSQAQNGK